LVEAAAVRSSGFSRLLRQKAVLQTHLSMLGSSADIPNGRLNVAVVSVIMTAGFGNILAIGICGVIVPRAAVLWGILW
jgi:hypothetical protein